MHVPDPTRSYWCRHPAQLAVVGFVLVVGPIVMDADRVRDARDVMASSSWTSTVVWSAVAAILTIPALWLVFRPSLTREDLRRGSLAPLFISVVVIWVASFLASHARYGPEQPVADPETLAPTVFSDVLGLWFFVGGLVAHRLIASTKDK